MKKISLFLTVVVLIIFAVFIGCGQKEQQVSNDNRMNTLPDFGPPPGIESIPTEMSGKVMMDKVQNVQNDLSKIDQLQFNTQDKRMIIRSGTMSIEVDKYDETEGKIKDIASRFSGYITNTKSQLNANDKKQGTISIRVPSDKFDAVRAELAKTGKVMNENITGTDVTDEYMDLDARQKTQHQLEQRLLKLLDEKTAKLTDVVEVEQKLASVRETIEKTEGRMKYLRDQASYSTLAISVYEPSMLITSTGGGFFFEIGQSFSKGLSGFTMILSGIITVVIALLPILIIAGIIIYFIVRYFKKRKLTKAAAA
jgi:predicted DNA binding CopG/RHH family protein